jgi:hypothetical protein
VSVNPSLFGGCAAENPEQFLKDFRYFWSRRWLRFLRSAQPHA